MVLQVPELGRVRRVHVVGIGGAGMSAIAWVLACMGHVVSGSDLRANQGMDRLVARGVRVFVGHEAGNLGDAELVAISSAVRERNPEVVAARERALPVHRRAEILAAICATRSTLAVAGTHGKTTTSSMLALILVEAGWRPSFIIGGDVNEIGTGAVWDDGQHLVVEADESDGTFLELGAAGGIVTNVEADHLDYYGSFEALQQAFHQFVTTLSGPAVVGIDKPYGAALARAAAAERAGVVTFGTSADADYQTRDVRSSRAGARFELWRSGELVGPVVLPIAGAHNAANAAAAAALALELGVPFEAVQAALGRFAGVARRLQFRGEAAGVTFIDDYAHLPSEVAAALAAVRSGEWGRVVAVFQPHRYSRTEAVHADFADSFVDADLVVLTDVYAAGESPRPGITGQLLVDAVRRAHPEAEVVYVPRRGDLVEALAALLHPDDACVTLGAGDLTSLADELVERLAEAGP